MGLLGARAVSVTHAWAAFWFSCWHGLWWECCKALEHRRASFGKMTFFPLSVAHEILHAGGQGTLVFPFQVKEEREQQSILERDTDVKRVHV